LTLLGNDFSRNAVDLRLVGVADSGSRAAGGGGCVSVLYDSDVHASRVLMDGNAFRGCSVHMSGSRTGGQPAGVQYGNTYGGAVSLYYGLRASSSLEVRDATSSFTNNLCHGAAISASVGVGGSAYGGCFSIYAGAWNVDATGSRFFGSALIDNMRVLIGGNTLTDCGAFMTTQEVANGTNVYGGGISISVGAYSYSAGDLELTGNTTVSSSSYTVSNNTLTNCTASSSTSSTSS
jgi:hypothetical protein